MMAERMTAWSGSLKQNEPMARHTSWRVGGPADRWYQPTDIEDLSAFLQTLSAEEPLTWIGLGSNVLVRDGGIRGTVIAPTSCLDVLEHLEDGRVRAEAGVTCAKVAKLAVASDLVGAEFFAGIPGTIGGALAMNAGAFGGETWPVVETVEVMDRFGQISVRRPEEFELGYRHVASDREEWFIAATFRFESGDGAAARERIRNLLKRRSETQPTQLPSGGSTFRNPPGDFAARLIEACGLKGYRIGGAEVSEKHANFLVNIEQASAADLEALIGHVEQEVFQQQGVRLVREVRIIGEGV